MIFHEFDTLELCEEIENLRQASFSLDAIIAIDSHEKMQEYFFTQSCEEDYIAVLSDTPYAKMHKVMPYLRRINKKSTLLETLLKIQFDWGFFAFSKATLRQHWQHWQSLCEVVSPQGEKAFFRFQDSQALQRMLPTFTEQELSWFMGLSEIFVIPSKDADNNRNWLLVKNPWLLRNKYHPYDIVKNYRPANMPWWEVREEHLEDFTREKIAALKYNLTSELRAERPHTAMLLHVRYSGLDKALDKMIDKALSYGFKHEEHLRDFVYICSSIHPDKFDTVGIEAILDNAGTYPDDTLAQLSILINA